MGKNKSKNELNDFPIQYFIWIISGIIIFFTFLIIKLFKQYWLLGITVFIFVIYLEIMISGGLEKESDLKKSLKKFEKNEKQIR